MQISLIRLRLPHDVTILDREGEIHPLPHLVRHSPTGFSWGYGGSGPSDLARSILAVFTTPDVVERCYQQFKWDVIATLEGDTDLSAVAVQRWLADRQEARD